MKHRTRTVVAILLLLTICLGSALSDTMYVKPDLETPLSLRDENTNEVLCTIPAGTALEPNAGKSTDLFAYVSYGGYSGYVLWSYLTRNASGSASGTSQAPARTDEAEPEGGPYTLKTVGAVIQKARTNNRGEGPEKTEMTVTEDDNVIVTAKIPKGSKLQYWVINGVRYDFLRTVKWMRITAFDRSWTIEAVYKKGASQTLRSEEEIQAARTGKPLIAQVIRGEMCHILNGTKGGGGWITSFDFTQDYQNRATEAREKGGQLTAKVRATIPKGKRVAGWKLDETKFYFPAEVNDFVVRTLDTSMTYEPLFSAELQKETAAPAATDPPNQQWSNPPWNNYPDRDPFGTVTYR